MRQQCSANTFGRFHRALHATLQPIPVALTSSLDDVIVADASRMSRSPFDVLPGRLAAQSARGHHVLITVDH